METNLSVVVPEHPGEAPPPMEYYRWEVIHGRAPAGPGLEPREVVTFRYRRPRAA